jgi:L-lactate permease
MDFSAALPLAVAFGAPLAVAAPLLRAIAHGLMAAQAKAKE